MTRTEEIAAAIKEAMAADTAVLIDVVADPDAMPPVTVFTRLPNY